MVDDEVLDRCLNHREVRLLCQGRLHGFAIEAPVRLGTRSAHRRSLACIQHPELDAGCVGHTAHETIESIDLPHQMALSQAADGGIAGHDADAVTAVRNQGGAGAEARGRGRGFTAGVPTTSPETVATFGSGPIYTTAVFDSLYQTPRTGPR